MRSRILYPEIFYKDFKDFFDNKKRLCELNKVGKIGMQEWTSAIERTMEHIAEKNSIKKRGHNKKNSRKSKAELLCVDYNFFEKEENLNELHVNNFPIISVEHENVAKRDRIIYNFNKLINLRSQLKVLICYLPIKEDKIKLIREFADFFKNMNARYDDKYLIIIGNSTMCSSDEFEGFTIYPTGFWKANE